MDLNHWHKVGAEPSQLVQPPACCLRQAEQCAKEATYRADLDRAQAVHAERRRVVTGALAATDGYGLALASVLEGDQAALAVRVIEHVAGLIQAAGCICPLIDVSTLSEPPGSRMIPGGDPRCGVHGQPGAEG